MMKKKEGGGHTFEGSREIRYPDSVMKGTKQQGITLRQGS